MRSLLLLSIIFTSATLLGQVVLVTGGSRGIGEAISESLSAEGYTVYAGCRTLPEEETKFHYLKLDVTDQVSIDKAVQTIIDREGQLDILVNNAGVMIYGSVENVTIEEAQALFDANFFGVMRVTQAVLPIMRAQKRGRIIQISSRSGFRPLPSISLYSASKFALEGLSETMAATLKPWNIHVSLIQPGPVKTDMDFISPYGSRLPTGEDPFFEIFETAGLLDPVSPIAQEPEEIAALVQRVIEADQPHFRYQTTEAIKGQAGERLCDVTGDASIEEWTRVLYNN